MAEVTGGRGEGFLLRQDAFGRYYPVLLRCGPDETIIVRQDGALYYRDPRRRAVVCVLHVVDASCVPMGFGFWLVFVVGVSRGGP